MTASDDERRMTDAQIDKVMNEWLNVLGLHKWRVVLESPNIHQLDGDGKVGQITTDSKTWIATVVIAKDRPRSDVLETIRHEALHLLFAELMGLLGAIASQLGAQTEGLTDALGRSAEEACVVQLGRCFDKYSKEFANGVS